MARFSFLSRKRQSAALITDARGSRIKNFDHRRHVYAALQWSRIPLLLLAGASIMWWDNKWLAAIFIVLSVPMSWIAVVIANGVGEPEDKRAPRVYKPAVIREENRRWQQRQSEGLTTKMERRQLGSAVGESESEPGGSHFPPQSSAADDHLVIDHDHSDHHTIDHVDDVDAEPNNSAGYQDPESPT